MEEQTKTSHAAMVAVIGALATVIVGVIPVVITLIQSDNSDRPTETQAAPTVLTSSAVAPIMVPQASEPNTIGDDQVLDQLALNCYDGDFDACDQLYEVSPVGSDYEWYGGTCGGILDGITDLRCRALLEVMEDLDHLAEWCYEGDLSACDELYVRSPVGSEWEWYGSTCGYRLESPAPGRCQEMV